MTMKNGGGGVQEESWKASRSKEESPGVDAVKSATEMNQYMHGYGAPGNRRQIQYPASVGKIMPGFRVPCPQAGNLKAGMINW